MGIKERDWYHLCKTFSATNQYRSAIMSLKSGGSDTFDVNQESLFIGLLTTKKGRQISCVELFADQSNPYRLRVPLISIEKPVEIVLHQGDDGADKWLTIEGENGTVASIIFSGPADSHQRNDYMEKLAFTIGERRGLTPGGDLDDWLNAEKMIEEYEQQFVR